MLILFESGKRNTVHSLHLIQNKYDLYELYPINVFLQTKLSGAPMPGNLPALILYGQLTKNLKSFLGVNM